jgi:hypothetical protein
MALRPGDFKSHASTDFAIRAAQKGKRRIVEDALIFWGIFCEEMFSAALAG